MAYQFVQVNGFQANSSGWNLFGNVPNVTAVGSDAFQLAAESGGVGLMRYILSDQAFRVRFNPAPGSDYTSCPDDSLAVVNRDLGAANFRVVENSASLLQLDLGYITLKVALQS